MFYNIGPQTLSELHKKMGYVELSLLTFQDFEVFFNPDLFHLKAFSIYNFYWWEAFDKWSEG
jgi:hypothetical protein